VTRVAVVTGAAGGIGAATCEVLRGQGWDIVPVDRETMDQRGAVQLDLGDPEAIAAALGRLERVDALINNAALQLFRPLNETSVDEWDAVLGVNARGPFACIQTLTPQLTASRGAIVNVASVHARATSASIAAYAASKGALVAFTRAAALELSPLGIRVNAVLPGAVRTAALEAGFARREGAEADLIARTPIGRVGRPEEIGEAIAFLADAERSGFITGQELVVDGGALARLSTE
jgi:NAD(P)-dependent dehydrogenase (short-subunit alcohol dehydrogenase family)